MVAQHRPPTFQGDAGRIAWAFQGYSPALVIDARSMRVITTTMEDGKCLN